MLALLALAASLVWGASDFVAGLLARRRPPAFVVAVSHAVAAVLLTAVVVVTTDLGSGGRGWLPWGLASGVVNGIGLLSLYAALASGTMGVVAPIASTGAVVPVLWGMSQGDDPSPLAWAGIVAALVGVVLASGPELSGGAQLRAVLLAGASALFLGLSFLLLDGGSAHSVLLTVWSGRIVSAVLIGLVAVVLLGSRRSAETRTPVTRAEMAGLGAVAVTDPLATWLYSVATTSGMVSVAAVLAALFPVVTVLLARVVLQEHLRRVQVVGVTLSLVGVALIAAG